MEHDSCNGVFGVGIDWAALEALGIQAVITAHGQVVPLRVGVNATFHLADTSPMNICRVAVLLIAGDLAGAASNAFRHVEVETVLLPFGQRPIRDESRGHARGPKAGEGAAGQAHQRVIHAGLCTFVQRQCHS
jgi:hypothetical protein